MFGRLVFESRHLAATEEVELELYDQRCPKAVENFVYLLTAHVDPPAQHLEGVKRPPQLLGSKVLRIDAGKTLEFGTSATTSVFGGFYADDEPKQQQRQESKSSRDDASVQPLKSSAGAVLVNNMGPNTNASHYVVLLSDLPELLQLHQQVGCVSRGLEALQAFAARVKVNPKTLVPLQPVAIADAALVRRSSMVSAAERRKQLRSRVGGVRRREDDDEDAQRYGENVGAATSSSAAPCDGPRVAKRRRGESVLIGEDGSESVITTAIPVASQKPFDMFEAQQHAFHNDLLDIKATQVQRAHNRNNRKLKFKTAQQKKKGSHRYR